ncbi:hypothetical protein HN865_04010 [Candidatus Woesearchaeota archaeon]|jgi:hypothetical protein|nr:hypothetical protein [archaeon]MBT3730853.1 hypothetical protein [archaeon]MBT7053276.1 hypothetical protein [archaeon]MBT7237997.1 hypothetical protein [Candidatus Woesearchaeota archaeon]
MTVEIVVNGYYRSGTTLVWNLMKEGIKNHVSFYEPLHPDLPQVINEDKENRIHKYKLWQEYLKLKPVVLDKLFRCHPNLGKNTIDRDSELKEYFDIYHNMNEKIILQTNRSHFFLDLIKKEYNPKVVHIIRHPIDVYSSMTKMYLDVEINYLKKGLKKSLFSVAFKKASGFDLEKEYNWIYQHLGYPKNAYTDWKIKHLNKISNFERFMVVWIISNYYALKSIERNKGLLLSYEEILTKKGIERLEKFLKIKVDKKTKLKKENYYKFNNNKLKNMKKVIDKFQLNEEWNYINKSLKKIGIDYINLKKS